MDNQINISTSANDTSVPYYKLLSGGGINNTQISHYLLTILEKGEIRAYSGFLHSGIKNFYEFVSYYDKKENLYLTAVDNLIKKNDFLQLTIQLDQELISEEEFRDELERNEIKYLIKMNPEPENVDFKILTEILSKLNREFTSDDASELFSIPLDNINNYIESKRIEETT